MNPEISYLITVHDDAEYLPALVESIKMQIAAPSCEMIVGTDGNFPDQEHYFAEAKDIWGRGGMGWKQYGSGELIGVQKLRNGLFKVSSGRFVIFCDVDLIFEHSAASRLHKAMLTHQDAAFAYGDFDYIGKVTKTKKSNPFNAESLKMRNYISTVSLIRRECFVGFDPEIKRLQDWDMWLTMVERGMHGVYVPHKLFDAYIHDGGISDDKNPRTIPHAEAWHIVRKKHGLE